MTPPPAPAAPVAMALSRRRALLGAGAGAAAAWVAPAIVRVDAAAAATPPPAGGFIGGPTLECGNPFDPGFPWMFLITVTPSGGGASTFVTSDMVDGSYLVGPLPAGSYDITFVPDQQGLPPQTITGVVVIDGVTTTQELDYTENGC